MRIQHNIPAMNAYRNYNNNTSALSKNLEKLSSGYRINRAGDDAAGLAISEKMRAQITGLKTAQKNAKDGISLVQTAEGALTEVHDMLNRMVELAEQSANGTYDNTTDRDNLQKELNQLRSEIDRIADSANFNGINLLDGSLGNVGGVSFGTESITAINSVSAVQGQQLQELGTVGANGLDGKKPDPIGDAKYATTIFTGQTATVSSGGTNTIVVNYNDNNGDSKQLTITISAGKEFTADDLVKVMNGGTAASMSFNDAGSGGAIGSGKFSAASGGSFNELYTVSLDGNTIKIEAKKEADDVASGSFNGDKLAVSLTYGDITTKEQYLDTVASATVSIGSTVKETTVPSASSQVYEYAKNSFTISGDGKTLHNAGVVVDGKLYLIKSKANGMKELTSAAADLGLATTAFNDVVEVEVEDGATAGDVAQKLYDKIQENLSADDAVQVTISGGTELIFSDTAHRAQEIMADDNEDATKKDELFQLTKANSNYLTTDETDPEYTGTYTQGLTIDASKLKNGSIITMKLGSTEKKFYLTNASDNAVPSGAITVSFAQGATSAEVASALGNAVKTAFGADGSKFNISGATITYKNTVTASTEAAAKANASATKLELNSNGSGLVLQIGDTAESFNRLSVDLPNMHCADLGIDSANLSIADQDSAANAIEKIKNAINQVSSVRGTLGATQNRLDHTINNLSVMTENIQDAESSIRDVDVAEEMMAYTKNNILVQSAQAMLAQANQLPQGVLQLLQ